MLKYDKIDITEGIDLNKTNKLKKMYVLSLLVLPK